MWKKGKLNVMGIPVKLKRIIKEGLRDLYFFDLPIMFARMYCTFTDESVNGVKNKNKAILDYLNKKYGYLVKRYQEVKESAENSEMAPVWVLWWDGERAMPDIIKMCHQSKMRAVGTHPIILLTKDNVRDYIDFPDYVWKQYEEKKICIQHLADMIRVQLIQRYGGLWLDASIYCAKSIPEEFFELPLYSIKGKIDERYVSKNQWTTFVIGGWKNNVLCSFLNDFFIEYCKSGKPFLDYFMFDCAIALAYSQIPAVKEQIDNLPDVKEDCYWLNSKLEEKATEQLFSTLKQQSTVFYKIAWSRFVNSHMEKNTFYSFLMEKEAINEEKG